MFRGLYTAYTGMRFQQSRVETISNNVANVNTTGYKGDELIGKPFNEILATRIRDIKINDKIGEMNLGVKVDEVYTDFSAGPLKQTYENFDVAINGDGFIKVASFDENGNAKELYTRDGSFTVDNEHNLVTKDGFFVLSNGEKIVLEDKHMLIGRDGSIYQNDVLKGKIDLVDFEDVHSLKKVDNSLFEKTQNSKEKPFSATLEQGYLEGSGVNSVKEMVKLIAANRMYESNQKVIQTYDETMSKVVNELGTIK